MNDIRVSLLALELGIEEEPTKIKIKRKRREKNGIMVAVHVAGQAIILLYRRLHM